MVQFNIPDKQAQEYANQWGVTSRSFAAFPASSAFRELTFIPNSYDTFLAYYKKNEDTYDYYSKAKNINNTITSDLSDNFGVFIGPFETKYLAEQWIDIFNIFKKKFIKANNGYCNKSLNRNEVEYIWFSPNPVKFNTYLGDLEDETRVFENIKKVYGNMEFSSAGNTCGGLEFNTLDGRKIVKNFFWAAQTRKEPYYISGKDTDTGEDFLLYEADIITKRGSEIVYKYHDFVDKKVCILNYNFGKQPYDFFEILISENTEELREAIKNGAPINYQSPRGYTPLMMLALYNDNYEMAKILLEAGADANMEYKEFHEYTDDGITAMEFAHEKESFNVERAIREHQRK